MGRNASSLRNKFGDGKNLICTVDELTVCPECLLNQPFDIDDGFCMVLLLTCGSNLWLQRWRITKYEASC